MTKPELISLLLEIPFTSDAGPGPGEFEIRCVLATAIEQRGIGRVGAYSTWMGCIEVLVQDEKEGRTRLTELVREFAPRAVFTIDKWPHEDQPS